MGKTVYLCVPCKHNLKGEAQNEKTGKILYWAPRVLSMIFFAFLTAFSLDVIKLGLNVWQTLLGLFMHNIPSIVLIVLLIIAWRVEIVGAVAFIGAGLLYAVLMATNVFHTELPWYTALSWSAVISGPAFVIGFLFLINWIRKKKEG
ncbi:MAG: hypothetical protein PHY64_11280 [Eubacteriales bacterium]|nr:hypothetical protein [Eubacteriales bacterium]